MPEPLDPNIDPTVIPFATSGVERIQREMRHAIKKHRPEEVECECPVCTAYAILADALFYLRKAAEQVPAVVKVDTMAAVQAELDKVLPF